MILPPSPRSHDDRAAFQRGNALVRDHQPSAALAHFAIATVLNPGFAAACHNRAVAALALGQSELARAATSRALFLQPDYAEAHFTLGNALLGLADPILAGHSFGTALILDPADPRFYANLAAALDPADRSARILHRARRLAPDLAELAHQLAGVMAAESRARQAERLYRLAISLDPARPNLHFGLANHLSAMQRVAESLYPFRRALTLRPDFAEAHSNLGCALQGSDRAAAERCFCRAVCLEPDQANPYNNLAGGLDHRGDQAGALRCFDRASRIAPCDPLPWNNRAILLFESGDLPAARVSCARAVELAPSHGNYYRMLAEMGGIAPGGRFLRQLQALCADEAHLTPQDRIEIHFALGKLCDEFGDYPQAFEHFRTANRLQRDRLFYDEAESLAMLDHQARLFGDRLPCGAATIPPPVFVVGMPRSGTSLVEQILASHPAIFGAGERRDLSELIAGAADDYAAPARCAAIGAAYLARLRPLAPDHRLIIDKMPGNFAYLGLIARALPGARIIHIRRDPLDTCLSCFARLFAFDQPFTYDLAELGRYYRAYDLLMRHWRATLPESILLEIRYEDLVREPEHTTRRMLSHCRLEWDEACRNFHRNPRMVRTASAAQVRRPIYSDSIGHWQAYRGMAADLLAALPKQ